MAYEDSLNHMQGLKSMLERRRMDFEPAVRKQLEELCVSVTRDLRQAQEQHRLFNMSPGEARTEHELRQL